MTGERWRAVEGLFHQAIALPASERDAWLEHACAGDAQLRQEVISLLSSDQAAGKGFLRAKIERAAASFHDEAAYAFANKRIGPYLVLREIGRGGMGTVFLAARDDQEYQKNVAIKLVRRGMDTDFILNRFRRERQILAHLEHPNIARFLDGGTTPDGLPYLVMEYIEGSPITEYCRSHGLNVARKLKLFLEVCSAVDCAHRHFIVHRDLKPGNILIDEAERPKLLDFGISKLLYLNRDPGRGEAETMDGRMMTPDYASPEQILGDAVGVASDTILSAPFYMSC